MCHGRRGWRCRWSCLRGRTVPRPSRLAVQAELLAGELTVPRPSRLAVQAELLAGELAVPRPPRLAVQAELLAGELAVPRPSRLAVQNFAERPIAHSLREPSRTGHQSAIREPIRPRASSQCSQHQSFCHRLAFHDNCPVKQSEKADMHAAVSRVIGTRYRADADLSGLIAAGRGFAAWRDAVSRRAASVRPPACRVPPAIRGCARAGG